MDGWNTSFLSGWPIFRGYVSFREDTSLLYLQKNETPKIFTEDLHVISPPPPYLTLSPYLTLPPGFFKRVLHFATLTTRIMISPGYLGNGNTYPTCWCFRNPNQSQPPVGWKKNPGDNGIKLPYRLVSRISGCHQQYGRGKSSNLSS